MNPVVKRALSEKLVAIETSIAYYSRDIDLVQTSIQLAVRSLSGAYEHQESLRNERLQILNELSGDGGNGQVR